MQPMPCHVGIADKCSSLIQIQEPQLFGQWLFITGLGIIPCFPFYSEPLPAFCPQWIFGAPLQEVSGVALKSKNHGGEASAAIKRLKQLQHTLLLANCAPEVNWINKLKNCEFTIYSVIFISGNCNPVLETIANVSESQCGRNLNWSTSKSCCIVVTRQDFSLFLLERGFPPWNHKSNSCKNIYFHSGQANKRSSRLTNPTAIRGEKLPLPQACHESRRINQAWRQNRINDDTTSQAGPDQGLQVHCWNPT